VTERITPGMANTEGHRLRYHLAAGFLERSDVVLDAACGIGYGSDILTARGGVTYIGIDKSTEYCEGPGTSMLSSMCSSGSKRSNISPITRTMSP
jgi:cyclopropane fatty-acyl-phospholipid synthase-like methyltransferase